MQIHYNAWCLAMRLAKHKFQYQLEKINFNVRV